MITQSSKPVVDLLVGGQHLIVKWPALGKVHCDETNWPRIWQQWKIIFNWKMPEPAVVTFGLSREHCLTGDIPCTPPLIHLCDEHFKNLYFEHITHVILPHSRNWKIDIFNTHQQSSNLTLVFNMSVLDCCTLGLIGMWSKLLKFAKEVNSSNSTRRRYQFNYCWFALSILTL